MQPYDSFNPPPPPTTRSYPQSTYQRNAIKINSSPQSQPEPPGTQIDRVKSGCSPCKVLVMINSETRRIFVDSGRVDSNEVGAVDEVMEWRKSCRLRGRMCGGDRRVKRRSTKKHVRKSRRWKGSGEYVSGVLKLGGNPTHFSLAANSASLFSLAPTNTQTTFPLFPPVSPASLVVTHNPAPSRTSINLLNPSTISP